MSVETFLIIYVLLIIIMIGFEIWFLTNNKGVYLRVSYKSLKRIIDSLNNRYKEWGADILSVEISRFYYEYMQEEPQVKKYFQNVVIWIDSVIFRIDSGSKSANCLKDYAIVLKESRDILEKNNPYNKCEKYQQGILCDINKLKTIENEILVQNIISRTEEEFLRLSGDIKKNNLQNLISIIIGILGIVVSILMAFVNF